MPLADSAGTQIHYEVHGDGEQTIVLLPGLGQPAASWTPVTELLKGSHRVIVSVPRGSGESDKPDEPYTADMVAADVLAVLDAAGATEPVHMVGLSMGGMIAQDFALRHPDRLRSLVLLSTFGKPDAWFERLFRFRLDLIRTMGLMEHFRIFVMFVFSPFAWRRIGDQIARLEANTRANPPDERAYLRQIEFCLAHDTSGELHALEVPTLVITGVHDILTPPQLGEELAGMIAGARFEAVELGSHGLWLEYPELLVELCTDFIRPRTTA